VMNPPRASTATDHRSPLSLCRYVGIGTWPEIHCSDIGKESDGWCKKEAYARIRASTGSDCPGEPGARQSPNHIRPSSPNKTRIDATASRQCCRNGQQIEATRHISSDCTNSSSPASSFPTLVNAVIIYSES